jgi:DNA-binding transcriptional LysR family regulator
MELRQLRYFVHVAEEEHIGRAARRLHITQSPLSRQIQDLERHLGVSLFERRHRRLRLTEAGRSLLMEARLILRQVERARSTVVRTGRGQVRNLDVASVEAAIASGTLPAALRGLRRLMPDVSLSLTLAEPEEQLRLLLGSRVDAGVLPSASRSHPELERLPLRRGALLLALSADDERALAPDLRLGDLGGERWIGVPRSQRPCLHDELMRVCARAGFVPDVHHTASGILALLGLVAAGGGVALVDEHALTCAPPGVVLRPLPELDRALETHLVWHRDNRSAALLTLVRVVQEPAG